jgi:hypothetical protein
MESGRVLMVGTPEEVRSAPEVIRSYLGSDSTAIERSRGADRTMPGAKPVPVGEG